MRHERTADLFAIEGRNEKQCGVGPSALSNDAYWVDAPELMTSHNTHGHNKLVYKFT